MNPQEGDFIVSDFQFHNGETLPELQLHYTTLGEPKRDEAGLARNAILIMHGTGGSGKQFLGENFAGELFGKGQILDVERYYIILPDGIGHGKSSKPSDGLRASFPHYGYRDMVLAQYRLVTEALDVNHLRLVMGTSMGGMQSWLWGQSYPDFMDALMPLASFPAEIAGRNRVIRRMMMDAIRTDPEWQDGNYTTQPRGIITAIYLLLIMGSSPLQWQKEAPTAIEADAYLEARVKAQLAVKDANDMLYQFAASIDYKPEAGLAKIKAPLLAINSADDQVNPPELGLMEAGIAQVKHGRYILLPITEKTRGHGTHTLAAIWKHHLADFIAETE